MEDWELSWTSFQRMFIFLFGDHFKDAYGFWKNLLVLILLVLRIWKYDIIDVFC